MPHSDSPKFFLPPPLDIERVLWDFDYRAELKRELKAIADRQGRRWNDSDASRPAGNVTRFPVEKVARPRSR